ncbi:MAG: ATPase domain-containing protein, partial [Ignavibacteria bacterium]|nr:ATPase domain-containing protein [Ignavibacteria bacterium]
MSKTRIKYICSNCGYESLKWLGKCPECDNWNTFTEEIIETSTRKTSAYKGTFNLKKIDELEDAEKNRIITGIGELDRVLGGGFIPGSVVLLGGDPGIGKSTLAMQ